MPLKSEPLHEKTNNLGFQSGPTKTELYMHRRWLEICDIESSVLTNCCIRVAKTKALISFAVTAKLICAFVFAYADCLFSQAVAHLFYCYVYRFLEVFRFYLNILRILKAACKYHYL